MSESLSDKLRSLGVQIGTQNLTPRARPVRRGFPIHEVLPGRFIENEYGRAFVVENAYDVEYVHGCVPFSSPCDLTMMAQWSRIPQLAGKDFSEIVFLDTETSGLAGGTGTFAFMIGLGAWTPDGFRLSQLFLEDPVSEPAIIAALAQLVAPHSVVVTFNGKAFDIPLLNTRHTLNGFPTPFASMDHIDLLQLARRLWKNRLASRALGNLEIEILGLGRGQEEIPGYLIPEMYFEYLRTQDARPLSGVFYHNAYDILSLAALFRYTAQLLIDPLQSSDPQGLDLIAIAQLHEDLGNRDQAIFLYQQALQYNLPEPFLLQTLMRFALLFRKQGDWQRAIDLWMKASEFRMVEACVELAKYYEHQARSYSEALQWTQMAAVYVDTSPIGLWTKRTLQAELHHRQERLEKKIQGGSSYLNTDDKMIE